MDINESLQNSAYRSGKIRRKSELVEISVRLDKRVPEGFTRSPVCKDRRHPTVATLYPMALEFGIMLEENSMKILKSMTGTVGERKLKLEINLRQKKLTAFFPMEIMTRGGRGVRQHKVVIDFFAMKNIYQATTDGDSCAIVLPLEIPPRYYWRTPNIRSTFSDDVKTWYAGDSWNRATDIVEEAGLPMQSPISLNNDFKGSDFIDIGRWTTLRFVLEAKTEEAKDLNRQMVSALHDFNINTIIRDDFQAAHGTHAEMWKHLDHHASAKSHNASHALSLLHEDSFVYLPFEVRYQLEVCISQGQLNEHKITKEFLGKLASMPSHRAKEYLEFAAERVLKDGHPTTTDPMSTFDSQRDSGDNYKSISRIPQYCGLVRRAVITPTTVRYSTPNIEVSNRVMRRFRHIQDRFLRIQFTEEMEKGKITVNKDQNDEIYKRILRTMYEGIRIGDRLYEFLAFGNSQLRSNGAYFFCPTEYVSCDDIRQWMGQFSHIKVVAKYAARLGQCFSTTRDVRGISSPNCLQIPDVERNGYCFTDGVVSHGGCKGVLAVWPEDAKGTEVHVRESQKKFESDSKGLEIIRWARYATATLNLQTILILECLGVPIRSFTTLLDQQLRQYELAMRDNDVAIEMLERFRDEQHNHSCLADLLRADFKTETFQEPFVVNVINLWQSWSIKSLKEKARIHVPKSAFVLGCVDETGQALSEIFLQISDPKKYNKTSIIRGPCVVGRNPSLHPGDIRVVEAVDCKALHHLTDVVVFPSTGDRPVPNMLSGGDLDGDDFFVIWDPSLMPSEWNHPPMNYSPLDPIELKRDVNVDDLRNFFVKYLKNDKLPLIAMSHRAFADELGPKSSSKCLELAELHSKAVDYPKTGNPAVLRQDQQPRKWPHWMEKRYSYHSRKALGVIYDKVAHKKVEFNPVWDSSFDKRITKRFELDNETLGVARKIKAEYDTAVRRVLSQNALKTEFELFTSFPLTRPAVGSDYKFAEDLSCEFRSIKEHYQDVCIKAAGGKDAEKLEPFVAAMYTVTEEQIKNEESILQPQGLEPKSMPLISFPWIFHGVMCRIATEGAVDPRTNIGTHRTTQQSFIRDSTVPQNPSPAGDTEPIDVRVLEEGIGDGALDLIDSQQDEDSEEDDAIDRLNDLIDG
ncbi:hypothetical protein NXS19_005497 [Fusarium pseudograminearum]|nr:hypothetical protein NXS19_005497 [Fusarium pseudograminearum]